MGEIRGTGIAGAVPTYVLPIPPFPQTPQSWAHVNGMLHVMYIRMMITVCWMDRITALDSPLGGGGR